MDTTGGISFTLQVPIVYSGLHTVSGLLGQWNERQHSQVCPSARPLPFLLQLPSLWTLFNNFFLMMSMPQESFLHSSLLPGIHAAFCEVAPVCCKPGVFIYIRSELDLVAAMVTVCSGRN